MSSKVKRLDEYHYKLESSALRQDFWLRLTGPLGEQIDVGISRTSEGVSIDVLPAPGHRPYISIASTWLTWGELGEDDNIAGYGGDVVHHEETTNVNRSL
jgi:hypothetical protein